MTIQAAMKLRQEIEVSNVASVRDLREAPGQPGKWVLDIRFHDAKDVETVTSPVQWEDIIWRRYPPDEDIVILVQGGQAKVCKHRDGYVFIAALNWEELESHAAVVTQVSSIAPKTAHGATFWLCPRALAARAVFPNL